MRPTRQMMRDALEKAARERRERDARDPAARAATEALDEWPDGPPLEDGEELRRFEAALRQWHQAHGVPWEDQAGG